MHRPVPPFRSTPKHCTFVLGLPRGGVRPPFAFVPQRLQGIHLLVRHRSAPLLHLLPQIAVGIQRPEQFAQIHLLHLGGNAPRHEIERLPGLPQSQLHRLLHGIERGAGDAFPGRLIDQMEAFQFAPRAQILLGGTLLRRAPGRHLQSVLFERGLDGLLGGHIHRVQFIHRLQFVRQIVQGSIGWESFECDARQCGIHTEAERTGIERFSGDAQRIIVHLGTSAGGGRSSLGARFYGRFALGTERTQAGRAGFFDPIGSLTFAGDEFFPFSVVGRGGIASGEVEIEHAVESASSSSSAGGEGGDEGDGCRRGCRRRRRRPGRQGSRRRRREGVGQT
mmetsp:Transcript_21534/g.63088  ORF Transcript_21534/g.63088 Transcript_21534/m.63088 type:complete len:336 (+) Transcript_21534:1432-2439(+)